jgi:hypothetical protein
MIKRLAFAPPGADGAALRDTLAGCASAEPLGVRPVRGVACVAVAELIPDQAHAAVTIEWFGDAEHLARCRRWRAAEAPSPEPDADVVVAVEHVLRGQDWLGARWVDGRPRLKHMAIARRAAGLTPAEFSDIWRNRAGRVGAIPVPEVAKGCAYAQNHPVDRADGDWRYDAVNEVWFDDEDALQTRIAWMADAVGSGGDDDFVGSSAFLAVREEVVISDV